MGVVFGTTVLASIVGRILYKWRAAKGGNAVQPGEEAPVRVRCDQPENPKATAPKDAAPDIPSRE